MKSGDKAPFRYLKMIRLQDFKTVAFFICTQINMVRGWLQNPEVLTTFDQLN